MDDQTVALSVAAAGRAGGSPTPHTLPGPDQPAGVSDVGLRRKLLERT